MTASKMTAGGFATAAGWSSIVLAAWLAAGPARVSAQDVRGKADLRRQLDDIELTGTWYYEDLPGAREEARRTGKPLLVVLRCPP